MAEASIPVDLLNPGQVVACLGFLEAADALLGDAEGGFDWSTESDVRFRLRAAGEENPFEVVLEFLAGAEVRPFVPGGLAGESITGVTAVDGSDDDAAEDEPLAPHLGLSDTFPCPAADRMALPLRLIGSRESRSVSLVLDHWTDGSSRNTFKLYSGNRSAAGIATAMLSGTRTKSKKGSGDLKTYGLAALWKSRRDELTASPFDVLTAIGGSFNFDARRAWTTLDVGYSPDKQKHTVTASAVVEILAPLGLSQARPEEFATRQVRYGVWGGHVPPSLARAALGTARIGTPLRLFRFVLILSGKNKVFTFSHEELAV
jgi:CRISPR-associated protein Csb3